MSRQPGKRMYGVTAALALLVSAASAYGAYQLGYRWAREERLTDTRLVQDFDLSVQMISAAQAQDVDTLTRLIAHDLDSTLQALKTSSSLGAVNMNPDDRIRLERALDSASKLALSAGTVQQLAMAKQALSAL